MSPSAMLSLQLRTPGHSRGKFGLGESPGLGGGMSPAAHRLASSMRGRKSTSSLDNQQVELLETVFHTIRLRIYSVERKRWVGRSVLDTVEIQ
jgi:hypothetical protein